MIRRARERVVYMCALGDWNVRVGGEVSVRSHLGAAKSCRKVAPLNHWTIAHINIVTTQ